MIEIFADNHVLYRSGSNRFVLSKPTLTRELNKCGTLKFDIAPNHPYYNAITKLKTNIDIYQNGSWLWSGRVLKDTAKINMVKSVECEGELNFLCDTIQRPCEYHNMTVRGYLETLINIHNSQVLDDRKFTVGNVTVTDPNDSLYRYTNNETTDKAIKDDLIDSLGGYLVVRHENGVRYLDYLQEYPYTNTQVIEFGKNIISLSKVINASDLYTVLIPYGARLETDTTNSVLDKRLTIEEVNNGLDYIQNDDAVAIYGKITAVKTWDDVTIASNLLTKAKAELNNNIKLKQVIELTAIDLAKINVSIDSLIFGYKTRIKVKPYNIDEYMIISKMVQQFDSSVNDKITLGSTTQTLTERMIANSNEQYIQSTIINNTIINQGNELNEKISDINNKGYQTSSQVENTIESKGYVTSSQVQTMINNAIGGTSGFNITVVESLPTTGATGTIYLIANNHGENNIYDEYIWVTDKYELIGSTDIDLSGYYQKAELTECTESDIDALF